MQDTIWQISKNDITKKNNLSNPTDWQQEYYGAETYGNNNNSDALETYEKQ